jgi:hypothetical protein
MLLCNVDHMLGLDWLHPLQALCLLSLLARTMVEGDNVGDLAVSVRCVRGSLMYHLCRSPSGCLGFLTVYVFEIVR